MNINYTCPFCNKHSWGYASDHQHDKLYSMKKFVVQGRGRFSTKQYFHKGCFEDAAKHGTYWNYKIKGELI